MSRKEDHDRPFGDYPSLWRIKYRYDQRIIRSIPGTGEVETVGTQRADSQYDIVALTAGLAAETFKAMHYSTQLETMEVGEPEWICYVDAVSTTKRWRAGHFA